MNLVPHLRETNWGWKLPLNPHLKRFFETHQKIKPLLVWAILVGILTGLIYVCFFWSFNFLFQTRGLIVQWLPQLGGLISILLSGVMVYVALWLVRQFAPEASGGGISFVEGVIDGLLKIRWQNVLFVKFFGSILTLGSGIVLGPEGPAIQMGGSIGEMIGRYSRVSEENCKTLIAAGAGAAMAAAFNAPLGGIIFVLEEMRPEFENRLNSWRAVVIAVIASTIIVRLFRGQAPIFRITQFETPPLDSLWIFALLGILLGLIGYWFNFLLIGLMNGLARFREIHYRLLGLYIGALIGLLTWLAPIVTGDGEDTIIWAFNSHERGWMILLVFLARFALTLLCASSGAPGGLFAPMLALATIFSLGFAHELHYWFPQLLPQPAILAIAGMGALVSASVRTPLTALIMVIEITNNYLMILAMMISCLSATMMAHVLGGKPIYSVLLQRSLSDSSNHKST